MAIFNVFKWFLLVRCAYECWNVILHCFFLFIQTSVDQIFRYLQRSIILCGLLFFSVCVLHVKVIIHKLCFIGSFKVLFHHFLCLFERNSFCILLFFGLIDKNRRILNKSEQMIQIFVEYIGKFDEVNEGWFDFKLKIFQLLSECLFELLLFDYLL